MSNPIQDEKLKEAVADIIAITEPYILTAAIHGMPYTGGNLVDMIMQLIQADHTKHKMEAMDKMRQLYKESYLDGRIQEAKSVIGMYGSTSYTPRLKKNMSNRVLRYKKNMESIDNPALRKWE